MGFVNTSGEVVVPFKQITVGSQDWEAGRAMLPQRVISHSI
jgi:hypothetical protein